MVEYVFHDYFHLVFLSTSLVNLSSRGETKEHDQKRAQNNQNRYQRAEHRDDEEDDSTSVQKLHETR